jgi:glutaredoxin
MAELSPRPHRPSDAILYGADGSGDAMAMAALLRELGVAFEYRSVSDDSAARKEWEDLDGEQLPVLRLGANHIVRGLDRIRVQQLVGWVGC